MKIGVRAHDYGRGSVEEIAAVLKQEGYEAVQLAIPKSFAGVESYSDITAELLEEIHEVFTREQIEIAVLGCYMDLGNPDEKIRSKAVETFIQCMEFSKIVGAKVTGSETSYSHLSKLEKRRWHPYMMEALQQIAGAAERIDADFAIEPVGWHPLEDAETAREVLDALNSRHAKIILDPANILERPDLICQKNYWEYVLELLGDDIAAVHLKDFVMDQGNYRGVLLGEGIMEYEVLEQWLKKHPDMPVLREEMVPKTAEYDLKYMRDMKNRTA